MKVLPAAGALLLGAASAQLHRPHHAKHHRRDNAVIWVTDWDSVTETVSYTTTIWVSSEFVPRTTSLTTTSNSTSATSASFSQIPAQFFQGPAKPAIPSPSLSPPVSVASAPVVEAPSPSSAPPVAAAPPAPASPVQSSSSNVVVPPPAPAPPVAVQVLAAPAPPPSLPASAGSTGECSLGSPCKGEITYYEAGLGACGFVNDGNTENVIALPHGLMGTQSNGNPYCGKIVTITSIATGKTTTAKVVDKCMGCVGYTIDLSNKAFLELDDLAVGRTGATWYFN